LSILAAHTGAAGYARLRELHTKLQSPEPDVRRAAYDALPDVARALLASAPPHAQAQVREQLHAYVAHAVRVERAAVDRAEGERLRIEREQLLAVRVPVQGSAAAGVRERQRIFENEDALQRKLAVLDRTTLLQEALSTAPRRMATPEELRILVRAERTEAAFTR